ncbi:macrophage mannose receptor 1-like [Clarias magur]|uniref:Macrophage mannose receptor 1-like n=1 Tax=Clarias magur TaxID=1594786 RepID=A0A8J4T6N0_CLAMG|nr:macrophage mannose receptor 1-like [Clarias magur]
MNQSEAWAACRGNYTDLVTVYSEEDNTELSNMTMEASDSWIGLTHSQFSMKWSNGDPVTFNNMIGTCDSSTPCAAMQANGGWDHLQCKGPKNFMCYEQNASSQTPIYHLILEKKTWYEAQSYCRGRYTDLVSIRDQQQNEEVKTEGSNSTNPFWIGLLCDGWHWSDGGNSAYRKWRDAEPQSSADLSCVVLSGGNWSTVSCSEKHSALCYSSFLHVSHYPMSWEKVLDYCSRKNMAGVLRISSADEQKDVASELRRGRISEPVWVGLRKSRLLGFWIWTDGTAVHPYSNWAGGKQPEGPVSQQCGAVVPPDYTWRDMNCQAQYRALCYTKCPS